MKKTMPFKLSIYQSLETTNWANPIIIKNNQEEVTITSIDKDSVLYQNYPVLLSDGSRCSINGKTPERKDTYTISYDVRCPIVDGRLVSDKTFALRFKNFLEGVQVNDYGSEEELEYLKEVARDLLEWQIGTAIEGEEKKYLMMNGVL